MSEARFPDRAARLDRPVPPRSWFQLMGSLAGAVVVLAAVLLLAGCECGVGWPCPR